MALGKMTSLILPYANTEMMNLFLEEVSRDFKDYFVIMLVDSAGWHRSGPLRRVAPATTRHGKTSLNDRLRIPKGTKLNGEKVSDRSPSAISVRTRHATIVFL